jgi:2-haloacid dehalogenase
MARYDIVLLDADMTIFDFERSEAESLHRTLETHGLPCTPEVEANYMKINHALWDAFARGEVDQDFLVVERFEALSRLYDMGWDSAKVNRDYLNGLGEEAHLLPGAMEFCLALKELGLTLAIATNGMPVAQRGRYTRTGMDKVIPHIFISMELGVQKPLPAYFDKVCEALNITDRSRVVMIGDSLSSDILGGNNAGIDTIWYNPKGAPLTGKACPTYTVSGYDEILALLQNS